MNIQRKLELARQHIEIIARHDDEDLAVRQAALQAVADHITAELQAASERVQAKVQAALGQAGDAKP